MPGVCAWCVFVVFLWAFDCRIALQSNAIFMLSWRCMLNAQETAPHSAASAVASAAAAAVAVASLFIYATRHSHSQLERCHMCAGRRASRRQSERGEDVA